jgi:hypothetical protein
MPVPQTATYTDIIQFSITAPSGICLNVAQNMLVKYTNARLLGSTAATVASCVQQGWFLFSTHVRQHPAVVAGISAYTTIDIVASLAKNRCTMKISTALLHDKQGTVQVIIPKPHSLWYACVTS